MTIATGINCTRRFGGSRSGSNAAVDARRVMLERRGGFGARAAPFQVLIVALVLFAAGCGTERSAPLSVPSPAAFSVTSLDPMLEASLGSQALSLGIAARCWAIGHARSLVFASTL